MLSGVLGGRLRACVGVALVAVAVVVVAICFLSVYPGSRSVPHGADTPTYVWRLRLVAEEGIDALPTYEGSHLLNGNADRPGLPVAYAMLRGVGAPEAWDFSYVFPAAMASITGLASVAIGRRGLGEWTTGAPLAVVVVGVSVPLVFAANGKFAEMMASGLLLAGVAGVGPALHGSRSAQVGVALCVTAAWGSQWGVTALIGSALLLGTVACIALAPTSLFGGSGRAHIFARLGVIVLASVAGGVFVVVLSPGRPQLPLGVLPSIVAENLERQVPSYLWSPLLPLAALGCGLVARRRGRSALSLAVLLAWAAVPLAGAAWNLVATDVPLYRLLSSALPLPVLAAAGVVGVARPVRGRGGTVRAAAAILVAVGLSTALVLDALDVWRTRAPTTSPSVASRFHELATVLEEEDGPIILAVDRRVSEDAAATGYGTVAALRRFRAALPADLIDETTVYLGDPDVLLAGRPSFRRDLPMYDAWSREAWRAVAPLLDDDPTVLVVRPYHDGARALAIEHPGWVVNPWLLVARGSLSDVAADPVPRAAPGWEALLRWTASILALIGVVGSGWAMWFAKDDRLAGLALAPAVGLALLVVAGIVLEGGFDVRAAGPGGRWVAAGLVLTGWFMVLARGRRSSRRVGVSRDEIPPHLASSAPV